MNPISVSPYTVLPDRALEETLSTVNNIGIDGIEVALLDDLTENKLADLLNSYELDLTVLAGQSALNPIATPCLTDPETHDEATEMGIGLVKTASDLGCHRVVVTLGGEQPGELRQQQFDRVAVGLEKIGRAGERHDVDVLIEPHNTVDYPGYIVTSYEEGKRLVDIVDLQRVGLLFDTYHVQRGTGNILNTYEMCSSTINHVHVANVPDRRGPDSGELNLEFVLQQLSKKGYDGPLGFEYTPVAENNAETQLRRSVELVEQFSS